MLQLLRTHQPGLAAAPAPNVRQVRERQLGRRVHERRGELGRVPGQRDYATDG